MYIYSLPFDAIVDYSLENNFADEKIFERFLEKFPNRKRDLIQHAINRGDFFLRPPKTDPELPERYVDRGWVIHNCSRRKDGMFWKGGAAQFGGPRLTQRTGK